MSTGMTGLLRAASRLTVRASQVLVGLVASVFAVLFSIGAFGLVAEALNRQRLSHDRVPGISWAAGLGVLFSVWAWRLISGRGSRSGGGLLSPFFYRLLGGAFMSTAVWASCSPFVDTLLEVLFFFCVFGTPAGLCFWAAHRLDRQAHPEHPVAVELGATD